MSKDREIIIVSACLAGVSCNYKGKASPGEAVIKLVKVGKAIPVCPEVLGGLPTPRSAAEIVGDCVLTKYGENVTAQFKLGAEKVLKIAQENGCNLAILKSHSPSCGIGEIYDGTFSGNKVKGNGITADLLLKNGINVINEKEFH